MSDPSIKPESLTESLSSASQLHQDIPLLQRRTRKKSLPDNNSISTPERLKPISRARRSLSATFESSGSHRSVWRSRQSAKMPSSDSSALSSLTSPKFTKTGRVSKAKKGVRGAHICTCGKVYSRAEHLRRHKQNHETQLPCPLPSCARTFHRQDLLDRHLATKHNPQNDSLSTGTPGRYSEASGSSSSHSASRSNVTASRVPEIVTSVETAPIPSSLVPPPTYPHSFHPAVNNDSIRYQPFFYAQSFEPTQVTSYPTFNLFDPTDVTSIKTESLSCYRPTTQFSAPWIDLGGTVESSYAQNVGGVSDYSSSGEQSPFHSYSFLPSMSGDLDIPLYPPHHPFDPWTPPNPTALSSPRSIAPGHHLWGDMERTSVPASIASSPASTCAAVPSIVMPQNHHGVPYPLPWIAQRDRYGTLDIEGLLEDQHLGVSLSLRTKQHYVEAYWKNFHPMFPVLHRQSYKSQSPSPLLGAAVMAIGAQYTDEQFAKGDSRILHEKCLELMRKYNQSLRSTDRLDYMQAIFLVEFFSHFKAKRAASTLSDLFIETYDKLWQKHHNTMRSHLEQLSTVLSHVGEDAVQHQWNQWIHAHAQERLLTAFYILESQQALLLVRQNQTPSDLGLKLFVPAQVAAWEATNSSRWSQLMRNHSVPVVNVDQTLDSIANGQPHFPRYEPFQCALFTACHAASVSAQKQEMEQTPFTAASATHPLFEIGNVSALEAVLCPHRNVQIMHHVVVLASVTPLRALLATSGESWVLSQRLSHEALLAAATFATLKNELHNWTNNLQPPVFFWSGPSAINEAHQSVQQALRVIDLALDTDAKNLAFGAEMALYYASLVLWAATYAAVVKAEASGLKFEADDTAEFDAPRAERDARLFVQLANTDIASLVGDGFPSLHSVDRWRFGVGAVLRWSSWVVGGAGMRSSGVGELMEGAVGVLEGLGRRGWINEWF